MNSSLPPQSAQDDRALDGTQDPQLEKKSDHNLEVAEFYMKKRKKYDAAINRLEEVREIYPQYTKIEKVYFLLGEAYAGAGKIDLAKESYKFLIEKHPDGDFAKQARKQLEKLK
ncbi:MAG: outer membrane protein assembly factor BamD [Blastocatellia bacterium]|nr:outer membrane protein assembly factor BamD [Blastocatellia bacterium]